MREIDALGVLDKYLRISADWFLIVSAVDIKLKEK